MRIGIAASGWLVVGALIALGASAASAASAAEKPGSALSVSDVCHDAYWPCVPIGAPRTCEQIGTKVWSAHWIDLTHQYDPYELGFDSNGIACSTYPDPPEGLPSDNPLPETPPIGGPFPAQAPPAPARCGTFGATTRVPIAAPRLVPSNFVGLSAPVRVLDTRNRGDAGYVCPKRYITVRIAGSAIPASAVAVALNVTIVSPTGAGFVTVWPSGTDRPNASTLNVTAPYQQRSSFTIMPVGGDGAIRVYAQAGAHVILDVAGYFAYAPTATSGRFVALDPQRLLDTRVGFGAPNAKPAPGSTLDVQIAGRGNVPVSGISAVAVNLTATEATAPGFVTAWPAGQPMPNASNLNLGAAGDTVPNLAIIPVGTDGQISLFTEHGTHLLADVLGYFTDFTATTGSRGLFVPTNPARVFDTRTGAVLGAGQTIERPHLGIAGLPASGVSAVFVNVTGTDAVNPGYIAAWPTGTPQPDSSTLNLGAAGEARANATILPVGASGSLSYFSEAGTHLVVDATGYFTD